MHSNEDQFKLKIEGVDEKIVRILRFRVEDLGISRHYVGQVEILSSSKLKNSQLALRATERAKPEGE